MQYTDERGNYVWRTVGGRRIKIYDGQSLKDAMKESGKYIIQKNTHTNYKNAKALNDLEYYTISEEFYETLTEKEKTILYHYGAGGMYSSEINDPMWRDLERRYRFSSDNDLGYEDKKIKFYDAIFKEDLDKEAYKIKSNDNDIDDVVSFNYERTRDAKKFFNDVDNIFDKKGISFDKDIILYRKGYETFDASNDDITRYGYTSTSIKSRIRKETPGHLKFGDSEFEIVVPAGIKVLPLYNIVPDDIKYQKEILLPRNINFKLIENKSVKGYNTEKMKFINKNKYLVKVVKN